MSHAETGNCFAIPAACLSYDLKTIITKGDKNMKARLPAEYQNKGAANMNQMIKQAQKMQDDIAAVQEKLDETEFSVSAGGGMIELTMTGGKVLKSVKLNPDCIDKDNPEDLEDIIIAGVNAMLQKVEEESTKEMEKVTGGLSMPGLF